MNKYLLNHKIKTTSSVKHLPLLRCGGFTHFYKTIVSLQRIHECNQTFLIHHFSLLNNMRMQLLLEVCVEHTSGVASLPFTRRACGSKNYLVRN